MHSSDWADYPLTDKQREVLKIRKHQKIDDHILLSEADDSEVELIANSENPQQITEKIGDTADQKIDERLEERTDEITGVTIVDNLEEYVAL